MHINGTQNGAHANGTGQIRGNGKSLLTPDKSTLRILSSDILITDISYRLPEQAAAQNIPGDEKEKYDILNEWINHKLKEKNVKRGGKATLTVEEFKELKNLTANIAPTSREPGGSAANTLTTLSKLLGNYLKINFLGVVGDDDDSRKIRQSLKDAHINLISPTRDDIHPEAATSFIFNEKREGKDIRTILTYPGNAKEFMTPQVVGDELIENSDVLFIQGSMWEKFNKQQVGDDMTIADKLLELRWPKNKEVWLALPTHAKFSDAMPPDKYCWFITSSDLVLGNQEELMRIYETGDLEKALNMLQEGLRARDRIRAEHGLPAREKEAMAFITLGEQGAIVVTPHKRERVVKPVPPSGEEKLFLLGAGDNSFAGFLAGYIGGLLPVAAAQFGMEIAGAKMKYDSPRIPDPKTAVIGNGASRSAEALYNRIQEKLASSIGSALGVAAFSA